MSQSVSWALIGRLADWAEPRGAIERALGHNGTTLVDVNVNPDEPLLPGKVEYINTGLNTSNNV